jgi:hypothetical protein
MSDQRCGNCDYFWSADDTCHLNPPTLTLRSPNMQTHLSAWPNVEETDWCGEWSAVNLLHIAAAGSYLLKTGAGWLEGMSLNTTGNGTLTIYDGIDATGTVMGVIDVSKGNPSPEPDNPWPFQIGLFMVLSAAADLTIIFH